MSIDDRGLSERYSLCGEAHEVLAPLSEYMRAINEESINRLALDVKAVVFVWGYLFEGNIRGGFLNRRS